jgi:preprotein translocase subunit SecA
MAGRGTDIKLAPESKAAGGLATIGTERHESRRVDRQLRGRAGRQGDGGSSQFFVSLEDNLMRLFGSERVAKLMDRMGLKEGEKIQHSMITKSIERAQKKVEENNFGTRKRLLEYDDVMNSQREVIYERRKNALKGERLQMDIMNMMYDTCEEILNNTKSAEDFDGFKDFFEEAASLMIPDFMNVEFTYPKKNKMGWRFNQNKCFAYSGIKRLGVIDQYECGVLYRIKCWLDALGITHRFIPEIGKCHMHATGSCSGEIQLFFSVKNV